MKKLLKNKLIVLAIILAILYLKSGIITTEADTSTHTTKIYATLEVGDNLQLGVDKTSDKITWETNKKSVISISSKGLVKATGQGNATITASSGDEKYLFNIVVNSYKVTPSPIPTTKPTLTPKPTPTPKIESSQDDKSITVYVTKTGSKYHRSGCRYLSRSKIPISLADAKKYYSPCSVCDPPQ